MENLRKERAGGWGAMKTKELQVIVRPRAILVAVIKKSRLEKEEAVVRRRVLALMALEAVLRTSEKEESGQPLEDSR